MHENVAALLKLGRIPADEISAELFEQYDTLLQTEDALTYEEAAALTALVTIAAIIIKCDTAETSWFLIILFMILLRGFRISFMSSPFFK